jgi:hypothetical protein
VQHVADQLSVGTRVKLEAFRTERMLKNHYAAKSLRFDGKTIQLRGEDLRPIWAGGNVESRGSWGLGRGAGRGRGPGWGRGRGYDWGWQQGRDPGYGRGPRWGRGPGYGRHL